MALQSHETEQRVGTSAVVRPKSFSPYLASTSGQQGLVLSPSCRQEVFPEPEVVALCLISLRVFVYHAFNQSCVNKFKIPHLQHLVGRTSAA